MRVAAHQPNFIPWLGFFDKLCRADVLVLLDEVDVPRTSRGSWLNRVKIELHGRSRWITCPLDRQARGRRVRDAQVLSGPRWRQDMLRSIEHAYARAPHFSAVWSWLAPLVAAGDDSLVSRNVALIAAISRRLGITTPWVYQSQVGGEGHGTALLASLVERLGGDVYLSGDGAGGYLEPALFGLRGLKLEYQGFVHPDYRAGASQEHRGLSILDALAHCGEAGTRALLWRVE